MPEFLVRGASLAAVIASTALLTRCRDNQPFLPIDDAAAAKSITKVAVPMRTLDDEFADVVPGFGGVFFDASGRLTVVMQEPASLSRYRVVIDEALRASQSKRPASYPQRSLDVGRARAIQGRFSHRELYTAYTGVLREVLPQISGLVLTDIDEARNRIVIGVASATDTAAASATLASRTISLLCSRWQSPRLRPRICCSRTCFSLYPERRASP